MIQIGSPSLVAALPTTWIQFVSERYSDIGGSHSVSGPRTACKITLTLCELPRWLAGSQEHGSLPVGSVTLNPKISVYFLVGAKAHVVESRMKFICKDGNTIDMFL